MALRSKAMQGLARRVMAPQSMLPVRSGGGGPVAHGRPPNRPVRLLTNQMRVPRTLVYACLDKERKVVVLYCRVLRVQVLFARDAFALVHSN